MKFTDHKPLFTKRVYLYILGFFWQANSPGPIFLELLSTELRIQALLILFSRVSVRIPVVTLVSLSKTLNYNCFSPPRGEWVSVRAEMVLVIDLAV